MNNLFEKICNLYNIGKMVKEPKELEGGITNKVYEIETIQGKYIIKVLFAKNIDDIEESEKIAEIASKNGVKSICAIKCNDKFVNEIDNNKFLVYKFYDGKILKTKEITVEQVKLLAIELAKLHSIEVKNKNYKLEKYEKIGFNKYYECVKNSNEECYTFFKENIEKLLKIYDKTYDAYTKLSNQMSYVHRDYNRKNVLWKNNKEFGIIDWETATIDNPSIDFFKSSWFLTADIEKEKFQAFTKEYFKLMKIEDDYKIGAYVGNIEECQWLEFSLRRALKLESSNEEEIRLGKKSIESSLTEIINYYEKVDLMLELLS